jgi:heme/copper-type cytochrome/quinol oxidase subunit 2
MKRLKNLKLLAVWLAVAVLAPSLALGCPTCKDGLAGDPAASGLVQGYFWSIVFMMSMPFLILGGVSAYFYYEICRARRQNLKADVDASENQVAETVTQV